MAPKLMAPKFVAPYRKLGVRGTNDVNDAVAIRGAVTRPGMLFVPVKSIDSQAILTLHRVRSGFVAERTATINRARGLMSEFGIVLPRKASTVRRCTRQACEDRPILAARALDDLLKHIVLLDERIDEYATDLAQMARTNEQSRRLMQMNGIGPITATALVGAVGNGHDFKNGRQPAAWLGLVPGQRSTGGKSRLGSIMRAGNRYLRSLLVLGARSLLTRANATGDAVSLWGLALQERIGYGKTVVAIAAKNARMAWAMLAKGEAFKRML